MVIRVYASTTLEGNANTYVGPAGTIIVDADSQISVADEAGTPGGIPVSANTGNITFADTTIGTSNGGNVSILSGTDTNSVINMVANDTNFSGNVSIGMDGPEGLINTIQITTNGAQSYGWPTIGSEGGMSIGVGTTQAGTSPLTSYIELDLFNIYIKPSRDTWDPTWSLNGQGNLALAGNGASTTLTGANVNVIQNGFGLYGNNTTWSALNPFDPSTGGSWSFNGSDQLVTCGNTRLTGPWTLQFWMRAAVDPSGINIFTPAGSTPGLTVRFTDLSNIQLSDNQGTNLVFSISTISLDTWYFVTVACDGNSLYNVWLNGTPSGVAANSVDLVYSFSYIGGDTYVAPPYFTGYMTNISFNLGSDSINSNISNSFVTPTEPLTLDSTSKLLALASSSDTAFVNTAYIAITSAATLEVDGNAWGFGTDGNLTLPAGSTIGEGTTAISGGPTVNNIELTPYGGGDPNQRLVIYPTAVEGNHVHLTSGNLQVTDIFLGDDAQFVKTNTDGSMAIGTNMGPGGSGGNVWTFGTDGTTTFPHNTIHTNNNITVQASGIPATVTAITYSSGGWDSVSGSNLATTGGTGSGLTVDVSQSGSGYADSVIIVTPGNGYTTGDTITATSGGASVQFTISVLSANWTFSADGNITLPAGGTINWSNGSNALVGGGGLGNGFETLETLGNFGPVLAQTSNGYDTKISGGATNNGYVQLISREYVQISSIDGALDNITNQYDWTFNPDGGLSTPILSAAPGSPAAGSYYTADGVNWDPASKGGSVPYPVFWDGFGYHALYS